MITIIHSKHVLLSFYESLMEEKPLKIKDDVNSADAWTRACQTVCRRPYRVKGCRATEVRTEEAASCNSSHNKELPPKRTFLPHGKD